MLDYYNLIPIFQKGKQLKFVIDGVTSLGRNIINSKGAKELHKIAKEVEGFSPRLAAMLEEAASSIGGKQMNKKQIKRLVEESQKYRRYTDPKRRSRINESLKPKNKPSDKTTEQAKTNEQPKEEVNKPGVTLFNSFKKSAKWINEHPKAAVAGGLVLGSKAFRDFLDKGIEKYNTFTFFPNNTSDVTKTDTVQQKPQPVQQQVQQPINDVDAVLNSITNDSLQTDQQQQVPLSQQEINDLFEQDQW